MLTLIEDLQSAPQLHGCRDNDRAVPLILFLLLLSDGLFRVQRTPLVRQLLHTDAEASNKSASKAWGTSAQSYMAFTEHH